jgi:hypothetical protein
VTQGLQPTAEKTPHHLQWHHPTGAHWLGADRV